jgi:hypothetical protein
VTSSRIGLLHLQYRARRGSTLAVALMPHLDRVLGASLADAIDARLAALVGDAKEVVVIRDLNSRVALGRSDWSLDSRVLDRIGRASADAIVSILGRPAAGDSVVRFADQAEFVGSFILEMLAGTAWDRWYYGAFHRYRQADAAATIAAVLDDNAPDVAAIFGWLERRGRLDAVLAVLGEERARELATLAAAHPGTAAAHDELAPLVAAAMALLDTLGWAIAGDSVRAALLDEYLQTAPLPAAWSERRSLTAWVWRFMRFVIDRPEAVGRPETADPARARALLSGPLDWLDSAWFAAQLNELVRNQEPGVTASPAAGGVLTNAHERALERLAELVRRGELRIAPHESRAAAVVRLLAAVGAAAGDGGPDRALIAAVERVAAALRAAFESRLNPERLVRTLHGRPSISRARVPGADALSAALDGVRAAGPAATALLEQLVTASHEEPAGSHTLAGGLFLLTRALLDVKLDALADDFGMPFAALKCALAAWWLDLRPPFDAAASLWVGAEHPDLTALRARSLADLQAALFARLHDQRAIDALPDAAVFDGDGGRPLADLPLSPEVLAAVGRIGWMLLRAWSRWLPGIGASGRPFLFANCLQRAGWVRTTAAEIALTLDPAPLDVVLEMAGYLRPIERVSWLDRRAVTFTVRRLRG